MATAPAPWRSAAKAEKLVAQPTGGLLDTSAHLHGGEGHIALAGHAGHTELLAEVTHEVAVGDGIAAEMVVEVGSDYFEAVFFPKRAEDEEGGDGVGSTADGDNELREAAEEPFALSETPDARAGRCSLLHHYLGKRRSHHSPAGCWSVVGAGLCTTNAVSPSRT